MQRQANSVMSYSIVIIIKHDDNEPVLMMLPFLSWMINFLIFPFYDTNWVWWQHIWIMINSSCKAIIYYTCRDKRPSKASKKMLVLLFKSTDSRSRKMQCLLISMHLKSLKIYKTIKLSTYIIVLVFPKTSQPSRKYAMDTTPTSVFYSNS